MTFAGRWYMILCEKMFGVSLVKKKALFIVNLLSVLPFLVFFRQGGAVAIFMLPIWPVFTIINAFSSETARELVFYNTCLALASAVGFACGQLFFHFVAYDSAGESIVYLEITVVLIYIAVITAFQCVFKHFSNKKKNS